VYTYSKRIFWTPHMRIDLGSAIYITPNLISKKISYIGTNALLQRNKQFQCCFESSRFETPVLHTYLLGYTYF
jgi:hypothetical protein